MMMMTTTMMTMEVALEEKGLTAIGMLFAVAPVYPFTKSKYGCKDGGGETQAVDKKNFFFGPTDLLVESHKNTQYVSKISQHQHTTTNNKTRHASNSAVTQILPLHSNQLDGYVTLRYV